jgi:hypothetical protein
MQQHKPERAADSPLHARLDASRPGRPPDQAVARARIRWLRRCLDVLGERPATMVALGWDHGSTSSELFANLRIESLVTIDVARERSLSRELRSADGSATYVHVTDYRATESADLAFTHGVFDHISATDQSAAAVLVYRSLKPGGLFAVWQRNPWSPVAMLDPRTSRAESNPLAPPATRRLLRGVGFDIVHTTSSFFSLEALTWIHPLVAQIPVGREYMVLARKP